MGYIIYGKRTKEVVGGGPDKNFAALDGHGVRVSRLKDAFIYDTKEEAQNIIDKVNTKDGVILEIRKK